MDLEERIAALASTDLFKHLEPTALRRLAEGSTLRTYERGRTIFHQGDMADSMFVLIRGTVKVVVTSERGDQLVLVTLTAPATFGELALVDGQPRSASVEVVEPAMGIALNRMILLDLLSRHPTLAGELLRSLGDLVRRLTDQAADFVFLDLHGRVAKLLVNLAEQQGDPEDAEVTLDLQLTQSDIARMVGGSRQSVNQILRTLDDRGYLELQGRKIVLKQLDRLKKRAGVF